MHTQHSAERHTTHARTCTHTHTQKPRTCGVNHFMVSVLRMEMSAVAASPFIPPSTSSFVRPTTVEVWECMVTSARELPAIVFVCMSMCVCARTHACVYML